MFDFSRNPIAYAIAIPLALVLGCLVSSPNIYSLSVLSIILFFFALPLLFKWHHALMIIFWNSAFNAFFLPGSPDFWLIFVGLSISISVLNHIMTQKKFLRVPEMTWPLAFLAAVILGTAFYRGGIGFRITGGQTMGGKYYITVLGAIVGYFALTANSIPINKGLRMTGLYFISGTTFALSNLVYVLGPAFFFLFYFVPTAAAIQQALGEWGGSVERIEGLGPFAYAALCFLLVIYGLRGLLDWSKPWRVVLLCLVIVSSFFAGFRSAFVMLFLVLGFQFYFEDLLRTRLFAYSVGIFILAIIPIVTLSNHLPAAVQRTLSFLPVPVDANVKADARNSSEWRFQIWKIVARDIPKYLLIGKGYGIDPTEMFLTTEASRMGILDNVEEAMLAGDYHSGPLSVIIPFGIMGVAGFIWVLTAGGWVLYNNYQYGNLRLRRANTVILSTYCANVLAFFVIFGAFNSQLINFLGAVGLSISLNGGVCRKPTPKLAKRELQSPPELIVLEPELPDATEV